MDLPLQNPYEPSFPSAAALPGRPLCWSSLHLLPNILRPIPLPLVPRRCHCGRHLHPLGDSRAACHLRPSACSRSRCSSLPRGWRPRRRNVDMNLDEPVADGRCLQIVANNGLGLYHGQQLAIDTTCISPITRAGEPHPELITSELTRARRCSSFLQSRLAAAGAVKPCRSPGPSRTLASCGRSVCVAHPLVGRSQPP